MDNKKITIRDKLMNNIFIITGIIVMVIIIMNPCILYMRIYYLIKDLILWFREERYKFQEYGCTIFVGEQGSGKTIGVVYYIEELKRKYPRLKVITNFGYEGQDEEFTDWRQLLEVRNGEDGVLFCIDEIQNEYNNRKWRDFPEEILGEITQQRKQRIKVILTAQYFIDVVIQLRRQCFEVVECKTKFGRVSRRYTTLKCYKAREYERLLQCREEGKRVGPLALFAARKWTMKFIQTDRIRNMYDTYEKVERLRKTEFLERDKRGL